MLFARTKKIFVEIDNKRERIEDFIANEILAKIDECKAVDDLEQKAIIAAVTAANAYLNTYGVPTIPGEIKEQIAAATVKGFGRANRALQKQLKKKSKSYLKRHGGNDD